MSGRRPVLPRARLGCGALPLARLLDAGAYEGFDVTGFALDEADARPLHAAAGLPIRKVQNGSGARGADSGRARTP
jgi:hypothetical protein